MRNIKTVEQSLHFIVFSRHTHTTHTQTTHTHTHIHRERERERVKYPEAFRKVNKYLSEASRFESVYLDLSVMAASTSLSVN